ncbi:MAG: hypothetical protein O9310_02230 [Leptospiraceae bacterium]|nr:hypothetical protein [Leptospiraceae bacterium]
MSSRDYALQFQNYLEEKTGLILSNQAKWEELIKKYSTLELESFLERIQQTSSNFSLSNNSDSFGLFWQKAYQLLNISETYFYRDPEQLDTIIFDVLAAQIQSSPKTKIRVWSAGCSKGEEVYTLAILLQILKESRFPELDFIVNGTDLQEPSIQWAKQGKYEPYSVRSDLPYYFKKFLEFKKGNYFIHPMIQKFVSFHSSNLLEPTQDKYHLIFCRNVMIYLSDRQKVQILNHFSNSLLPNGILVTGHSEVGEQLPNCFSTIHIPKKTTYYLFDESKESKISRKAINNFPQETLFVSKLGKIPEIPLTLINEDSQTSKRDLKSNQINKILEQDTTVSYLESIESKMKLLKQAIYLDPEDIHSYYELSSLLWEIGEREQAKIYQSRIRVLVKNNPIVVDKWKETKGWNLEWEAYLNEDL